MILTKKECLKAFTCRFCLDHRLDLAPETQATSVGGERTHRSVIPAVQLGSLLESSFRHIKLLKVVPVWGCTNSYRFPLRRIWSSRETELDLTVPEDDCRGDSNIKYLEHVVVIIEATELKNDCGCH